VGEEGSPTADIPGEKAMSGKTKVKRRSCWIKWRRREEAEEGEHVSYHQRGSGTTLGTTLDRSLGTTRNAHHTKKHLKEWVYGPWYCLHFAAFAKWPRRTRVVDMSGYYDYY